MTQHADWKALVESHQSDEGFFSPVRQLPGAGIDMGQWEATQNWNGYGPMGSYPELAWLWANGKLPRAGVAMGQWKATQSWRGYGPVGSYPELAWLWPNGKLPGAGMAMGQWEATQSWHDMGQWEATQSWHGYGPMGSWDHTTELIDLMDPPEGVALTA